MNSNISFAKIVATPTPICWSQAYNAGHLFAVLSLQQNTPGDEQTLGTIGKQIINNLEAEFFTLETKDLTSIKKAITDSINQLPEGMHLSFELAYIKEQIVYVLLIGEGTILLKRKDAIGTLLHGETDRHAIKAASGYLQSDDVLLLQTAQFTQLISPEILQQALELSLPSDIAETLTPHIHKAEEGGAAAIILTIKGTLPAQIPHFESDKQEIVSDKTLAEEAASEPNTDEQNPPTRRINISRKRVFFLILVVILAVGLLTNVSMTLHKQQSSKQQTEFQALYKNAAKDYDEGVELRNLNPTYSQEDFQSAKKKLETGIPKFPKGSEEEKKLSELLTKVNTNISEKITGITVTTKSADTTQSPLLKALIDHKDAIAAAVDADSLYVLSDSSVLSVLTPKDKVLIKNNSDWSAPVGLAAYHGNLYILDKKEGVLKYVAGSDGYGKNAYFVDSKPDLSKAVSIAIDSSIYILYSDGRIDKYTKGNKDSFSVKGLPQSPRSPTAIVTTVDSSYLYILDPGNAALLVITKDGNYKISYHADILKTATALDVHESDKKVYVLSGGKVYELPLQ